MAKAKKEPVNTAMVTSAIGIAAELQDIVARIESAGGECDDETLAALQSWSAALEVKAESIAHVKLRLEADAEYWQKYEDAARAMRKSKEAAVKRLTEYLARCMSVAGVKSIRSMTGFARRFSTRSHIVSLMIYFSAPAYSHSSRYAFIRFSYCCCMFCPFKKECRRYHRPRRYSQRAYRLARLHLSRARQGSAAFPNLLNIL